MSQLLTVFRESTSVVERCDQFAYRAIASVVEEKAKVEQIHEACDDVEAVVLQPGNIEEFVKNHLRYFTVARELDASV